jgi:hypothetical protein
LLIGGGERPSWPKVDGALRFGTSRRQAGQWQTAAASRGMVTMWTPPG